MLDRVVSKAMRSKAQTAEAHSSIQEAIPEDLHDEIHKVESNIVRDDKRCKTLDPGRGRQEKASGVHKFSTQWISVVARRG